MHKITLAVALSLALVAPTAIPAYGQMTDPYGSRLANPQSGYTGAGIRGTVRANTTTRSVRTPSNLGASRPLSDRDYDLDGYPTGQSSRTGLSDSRLRDSRLDDTRMGRLDFDPPPLGSYRTADNRARDSYDRTRLEDDDRDRTELERRELERRDSSALDYERRLPPVGSRDARSGNPESDKAADMLKTWIELATDEDTRRVLSLPDAIGRVNGTKEQIDVVKIYWGWVLAMAELRGMADEEAVLAEIARSMPPRTSYEQSLLRSSVEACRSRSAEAKRDVIARLVDLQEVSGQRSNQAQLPGNVPFVDAYDTQFERVFANRTPPANLRKIHNTLPEDLKVIRARAVAADESMNLMAESAAAYFSRQIPLTEVLESIHDVRAQRRAFLEAVHHYNSTIAEYAITVAGNSVSKDGIVSMLIGTSGRYVAQHQTTRQRMAYGSTYSENLDRSYRSDPYTALGNSRGTYQGGTYPATTYGSSSGRAVPVRPSSQYENQRYRDVRDPYVRDPYARDPYVR
jgi:hypothetical protein